MQNRRGPETRAGIFMPFFKKKHDFPDGSAGMPHIYVPLRRCEAGLFILCRIRPG